MWTPLDKAPNNVKDVFVYRRHLLDPLSNGVVGERSERSEGDS